MNWSRGVSFCSAVHRRGVSTPIPCSICRCLLPPSAPHTCASVRGVLILLQGLKNKRSEGRTPRVDKFIWNGSHSATSKPPPLFPPIRPPLHLHFIANEERFWTFGAFALGRESSPVPAMFVTCALSLAVFVMAPHTICTSCCVPDSDCSVRLP